MSLAPQRLMFYTFTLHVEQHKCSVERVMAVLRRMFYTMFM